MGGGPHGATLALGTLPPVCVCGRPCPLPTPAPVHTQSRADCVAGRDQRQVRVSSGVVLGGGQQRASLGMAPRSASLTAAQSCLAAPQPIHRTVPGCLLCPGHCHSAECVSERSTAVLALMSSYRPPRHLHTRSASSAHGKSGCWARWRGVPSACLGGVRHSGDGLGILCPILGPARGGEGQGPPEVSVTTAAVCTPPPVTDTAPQPREGNPLLEKWPPGAGACL